MKEVDDRCFGECMGEIISCIYMIMRISTGQKYIGQTNDFYRRVGEHCSHNTMRIDKAISKYGKDDFIFQVLEILPNDIKILNNREDFWINYYNTYENPFHYNERQGGCNYVVLPKHKAWSYADEICSLYQNNKISSYDLAKQFDCSSHTIVAILKENNIKIRGRRSIAFDYIDKICDLYQNNDIKISDLSKNFNCSSHTIRKILKQNNMEMDGKKNKVWYHVDEVCRLYQNTNMSTNELGIMFNCDRNVINRILKQNNIKVEYRRPKKHEAWNYANEICDLYFNTNIGTRGLAERFDCSHTLIRRIVKETK